jgi:hypothetical protein
MSKYNLEINYLLLGIDISPEELAEINAEADVIIAKNSENPEKTAETYLKKSQCLQKMERYEESRKPLQKTEASSGCVSHIRPFPAGLN